MSEPVKLRPHAQAHCKDCSLAPLCLPLSLNLEDMDALVSIVLFTFIGYLNIGIPLAVLPGYVH
ncbi:hypothetical protein SB756_34290, partial [Pseudomonas sp. SIMBA_068]